MEKIDLITADTHTSEYLMHKYWARKPHNVISYYLKKYGNEKSNILDPFMGSGVVINEAIKCGFNATGIDINPTAYNISKVLTTQIDVKKFESIVNSVLDKIEEVVSKSYSTIKGDKIKYTVHSISAKCDNCNKVVNYQDVIQNGKKTLCPQCENELHFNLENLVATNIDEICAEKKEMYIQASLFGEKQVSKKHDKLQIFDSKELKRQLDESNKNILNVDLSTYNYKAVENRRILAFNGLETNKFFTVRNFSILTYLANEFHKIKDKDIKDAALCLLTGSAAQCSRLIPYRNNMSTGGPAWSVPGFWVPQKHLETNPLIHIRARLKKYLKAYDDINNYNIINKPNLLIDNSLTYLSKYKGDKFDIIFLDPPYGDSVPYTEFSFIWNSFLKSIPNVNEDISVSDRIDKNSAWEKYNDDMDKLFSVLKNVISEKGRIITTFNNNDMRAWTALLGAIQKNNFKCIDVDYLIPAVISSKAAFNPTSSYISDIYSTFEYLENNTISSSPTKIKNHLINVCSSRKGIANETLIDREFIITILKNNLDVSLINNKKNIYDSIFEKYDKKDKVYYLKKELMNTKNKNIEELLSLEIDKQIKKGETELYKVYKNVAPRLSEIGIPEFYEFKNNISSFKIENGKFILN